MIDLALWVLAIVGASALATSLATSLAMRAGRTALARVEPRARARIVAFLAFLPLVVAALVIGAVLLPHPWLGLPEHCFDHDDHHLHLCLVHGAPAPSLAILAVAAAFAARVLLGGAREASQVVRATLALRRLRGVTAASRDQVVRLPLEAPLALTAGWWRPQVFASRPITDGASWDAVLAHEHDHVRHRDPLTRLLVRFAVALHAPGVAGAIVRELEAAQEHAADEEAARAVGDRFAVAEQILAYARVTNFVESPAGFVAFAQGDLERRVRALLDPPTYVRGPSLAQAAALVLLVSVLSASMSTSIHHGLEDLLTHLGG